LTVAWHLIEGDAGCEFAVRHACVAVVVDALRASATAALLLEMGAREILAVREVEDALRAKQAWPDALLYGERGGLPPEDFDYGNSPQSAAAARGRRVVFTTTTGAGRLVSAWGAAAAYLGTTVNATAVAEAAAAHRRDVVLIPAGLTGDPQWPAQEDWVAATVIARVAGEEIGEGAAQYAAWCERIDAEGVRHLFETAPHADKLRRVGLESDIPLCSEIDVTRAVPKAVAAVDPGILLRDKRA
jgi:2-phosphosulfolactate phosphatase